MAIKKRILNLASVISNHRRVACRTQIVQPEPLKGRKEMLSLHTRTQTFLSFHGVSSHPKTIQLITGFIVGRPTQFIDWLRTNTDSLSVVGTVGRKKKTQQHWRHSHVSAGGTAEADYCFDCQSRRGCVHAGVRLTLLHVPSDCAHSAAVAMIQSAGKNSHPLNVYNVGTSCVFFTSISLLPPSVLTTKGTRMGNR